MACSNEPKLLPSRGDMQRQQQGRWENDNGNSNNNNNNNNTRGGGSSVCRTSCVPERDGPEYDQDSESFAVRLHHTTTHKPSILVLEGLSAGVVWLDCRQKCCSLQVVDVGRPKNNRNPQEQRPAVSSTTLQSLTGRVQRRRHRSQCRHLARPAPATPPPTSACLASQSSRTRSPSRTSVFAPSGCGSRPSSRIPLSPTRLSSRVRRARRRRPAIRARAQILQSTRQTLHRMSRPPR
jgi:hypothetical protein